MWHARHMCQKGIDMGYIKEWNKQTENAVRNMAAAGIIKRRYLGRTVGGTLDTEMVIILGNEKSEMAVKIDRLDRESMRSMLRASTTPMTMGFAA